MKLKKFIVILLSCIMLLSGMQRISGLEDSSFINENRGLHNLEYKPNKLPLYNPLFTDENYLLSVDEDKQEVTLINNSNGGIEIDLSEYDFPVSKIIVEDNIDLLIKRVELNKISLDIKGLSKDTKLTIYIKDAKVEDSNLDNIIEYPDRVEFIVSEKEEGNYSLTYDLSQEYKDLITDILYCELQGKSILNKEESYTKFHFDKFADSYNKIMSLFDKVKNEEVVLIKELEAVIDSYKDALSSLEFVGDFSELKQDISEEYYRIESDMYTEYAVSILLEKINSLEKIIDTRLSSEDIENYRLEFTLFIDNLDKVVEMDTYNKFLNYVKDLDLNLYTDESVAVYLKAKEIHINEMSLYDPTKKLITSIEELDFTYYELIQAYKNLVLKAIVDEEEIDDDISQEIEDEEIIEDEIIDEEKKEVKKDSIENDVITSLNYPVYSYLIVLGLSLLSLIISYRYRNIN